MASRWEHLKDRAIALRKSGETIPCIESRLGIPRSTLSGWFRKITIPQSGQRKITARKTRALVNARKKAAAWHRAQKEKRVEEAHNLANDFLEQIYGKEHFLELALAFLYLGEGAKRSSDLCLGNSNPRILKFFITAICELYNVPRSGIKCELHLRADQDPVRERKYWAKELGLSENNFYKPLIDKRTVGTKTYPHYHGVCSVRCARVALQRKLMYIADKFCDRVTEQVGG